MRVRVRVRVRTGPPGRGTQLSAPSPFCACVRPCRPWWRPPPCPSCFWRALPWGHRGQPSASRLSTGLSTYQLPARFGGKAPIFLYVLNIDNPS